MPTARDIAFSTLAPWTALTVPPLLPDRSHGRAAGAGWDALSPRDRAFAFDLVTGVIRWRGCLDAVVASRLRQPLDTLDPPVRALLWLGAYQLLFQSGTTDYAAVDTTVSLARARPATAKAAGLVNAVLRGVTRLLPRRVPVTPAAAPALSRRAFALDFSTHVQFAHDVFPDPADLTAHLAATRSHPTLYVGHLRRLFGDATAADLLLRNNLRPVVTLRVDADSLDAPAAAGLVPHATAPRFLVAAAGWNDAVDALVREGKLSPQDPTAAKPVRRAAESLASPPADAPPLRRPARVLDLCAGLGTKSVQLARAFPDARVLAADVDPDKLQRLAARARQVRQANIDTTPAADLAPGGAPFDLVLVDVPCSNTGVMAKRVQSRWRWPTLDKAALLELQRRLLAQGRALLAPGGLLVYATCSIDPDENGAVARTAPDARLLEEVTTLPSHPPAPTAEDAMHDGGYFALLTTASP
jgi:16S rRNA (cytosine967-C5)-methyltransferase